MTDLTEIKRKLPEAMILDFLNSMEDCTIELVMLLELGVYTRKDHAVRALKRNFQEGIEFSPLKGKTPQGGRPSDAYLLTSDCFKEMCILAETPTGKLVRKYYIEVERQWKRKQKKRSKRVTVQPNTTIDDVAFKDPLTKEIERIVSQWLGDIFTRTRVLVNEVSRESDRCFALIVRKATDEQIDLVNTINKGIDQISLEVLARGAINRIIHRVPHQPGKISKVVEEQVHSHQEEFVQMLVSRLMELQALEQPALPPAEEFPVQRTSSQRRRAVIEFIFELIDQYGSLDAIPRRGKGKAGINLEVEWGTNKLSKQFGVSPNTILSIWSEVDEVIKEHGETGARQHLHL